MTKKKTLNFELSVSGRDDGTIEAIYITLLPDEAAKTVEVERDQIMVDYNANGEIVGIEVLAPVKVSQLTGLLGEKQRSSFQKFVRTTFPESFTCS